MESLKKNNPTEPAEYPYIKDSVIFRRLNTQSGNKTELFSTENSVSAETNNAGGDVLAFCDGQHNIEQICREICNKYAIDLNDARQKIEKVIQPLQNKGLIEVKNRSDKKRKINEVVDIKYSLDNLFFECTLKCNLKCLHCYACAPFSPDIEMDIKNIKSMFDQFAEAGGIGVTISGGEPLLREDIYEIIEYAVAKPLNILLLTNATLIDEIVAVRLKKTGLRTAQISLDGPVPSSHDKYRGKDGSFVKTIRGIELLKDSGISIKIGAVLNKLNNHQAFELIDFCQKWDVIPNFGLQQAKGRAKYEGKPYELSFHEYTTSLVNINKYLGLKYGADKLGLVYHEDMKSTNRCNAGISSLAVTSNGDMWPCRDFIGPNNNLGNINDDKLLDIWNSDHQLLNMLRNHKIANINLCNECKHVYYCGCGCPLDALEQWGDYNWPDIQKCALMKLSEGVMTIKRKGGVILEKADCKI